MDQRLNWNEQCKTLRGKAFRALSALRPLFMSSLPLHTKLLVYNAFIRPLMTYASPVWAFISKTNMNRLQVVQNKALRIIGGYDWYTRTELLHFDNEILMLNSFIKKLASKLYSSVKTSRNKYIKKSGSDSKVLTQRAGKPSHLLI